MCVASMDIKTAFRVARPKHIANIMDSRNIHGWIVAALLRKMAHVEGKADFEGVECSFPFTRCIRQGSVEVLRLWLKMATQILWNVEYGGRGRWWSTLRQLNEDSIKCAFL